MYYCNYVRSGGTSSCVKQFNALVGVVDGGDDDGGDDGDVGIHGGVGGD